MRCYVKECSVKAVGYCSRYNWCKHVGCATHLEMYLVGDKKESKLLCSHCSELYHSHNVILERYSKSEREE